MAELRSDVDALIAMPPEVPARDVAGMGKQRVRAGLNFGRIEEEFGFAVFLRDRVVAGDGDLSEGLAVGGEAIAEDGVVQGVGKQGQTHSRAERDDEPSLEKMFDTRSEGGAHGVRL